MGFQYHANGTLKAPSKQELEKTDENIRLIAYVPGMTADGRQAWMFIAVKPSLYAEFHAKTAEGVEMIMEDYGEIVESGFDAAPSSEVLDRMRGDYGYDEALEHKLTELAKAGQKTAVAADQNRLIAEFLAKNKPPM